MARTPKKTSASPAHAKPEQLPIRKHEYLAFRKVVLLAGERMGRETNRMSRDRTHYENMHGVAEATGINRTSIAYIKKRPDEGGTQTPSIDTFQRMADWLATLEPPLKDENGTPIQYNYLELIDLNERAKAVGDSGDLYVASAKQPEPSFVDTDEDPSEDDDEDDEETAATIAKIVAMTLAQMKADKQVKRKAKEK